MKQHYTYLDYLAEVNNLELREHNEYLQCLTVIKKHVLNQFERSGVNQEILNSRLDKLESMTKIHSMMKNRLQSGKTAKELISLN